MLIRKVLSNLKLHKPIHLVLHLPILGQTKVNPFLLSVSNVNIAKLPIVQVDPIEIPEASEEEIMETAKKIALIRLLTMANLHSLAIKTFGCRKRRM